MCHEQWECGVSLPPTSLSTLLQTELELLHPPKAQPGTNQGVPGGFGVPDQHSTAAGSTKSTTLTVPSSRGCHRDTTLLPPPASPALRHTRRGHSHGSKAIPKSGTGGQQKPQSNEPPTPCSSAETPTRCPGSAGTGTPSSQGHGRVLAQLAQPEWPKQVPMEPTGRGHGQLTAPGRQWNLAAGFQLVFPDNN